MLSDEPYRRIRFDDRDFVSPAQVYPWSVIAYSYGKVLLVPGQRLGYLAVSPHIPRKEREEIQNNMFAAQMALGCCFPNAIMQYAIPDLEGLSIDMSSLSAKRNRVVEALETAGYEAPRPEGTFYLFCKWPGNDPERFWNALADRDVFVMPGSTMNVPDHFRICLTASKEMVERSLPVFAEVADLMRTDLKFHSRRYADSHVTPFAPSSFDLVLLIAAILYFICLTVRMLSQCKAKTWVK